MTASDKARRVWDKTAPTYDRQMAGLERVWFTGGREWIGARARGRVLEVAIGTGRNLPHYPADATVTGLELSPEMLARARRRAADLGRAVTLHEGDAERLPFADASFDTVVCALSLCAIPHPGVAIAEMHRVLIPGGRLCCSTMCAAPGLRCTRPSGCSNASPSRPPVSTSPAGSCPCCAPRPSRSSRPNG